jgi:hypothetical protein
MQGNLVRSGGEFQHRFVTTTTVHAADTPQKRGIRVADTNRTETQAGTSCMPHGLP